MISSSPFPPVKQGGTEQAYLFRHRLGDVFDELDGNLVAFLLGDREADLLWDGLLHLDGNGVSWGRGGSVGRKLG